MAFETLQVSGEGCEREELLWLLSACCGPTSVLSTQQIFGRGVKLLNRNLQQIRNCADLAAGLNRSLFGALLRATPGGTTFQSVPENLRALADLVEAAKRDFKNAEWFLSTAKIRLTDHVMYKTHDGKPHDSEVSGLISCGYWESLRRKRASTFEEQSQIPQSVLK